VAVVGRLAEVLFPAISNLQGQKRDRAMVDLMLRGSWLIALLMVSAQTTLMVFADDVLRLYMHGKLPGVATSILRLSCAGAIVTAATPGVSQFLLGTGRTGWMAWMSISAGVLTLVADLILIPTKGINGAAWGGAMAVIISRPLIYLLLWFKIFRATTSFRKQFAYLLGPSIPGIVLALALQTLHDELKPSLGWIGLGFWSLVTFGFSGLLLVWIDGFLPESAQRRADLYSLLRLVTRQ
jgi:O-antigen/teichoic acid export membrane protein